MYKNLSTVVTEVITESTKRKYKVGDRVILNKGPMKGMAHILQHDLGDGHFGAAPILTYSFGRIKNRYRGGGARVNPETDIQESADPLLAASKQDQINYMNGLLEKKLDPVGDEDEDVDNDGDSDSSDEYIKNRRKTIGKKMKKCPECGKEECECDDDDDDEDDLEESKKSSEAQKKMQRERDTFWATYAKVSKKSSKPAKIAKSIDQPDTVTKALKNEQHERLDEAQKMKKWHLYVVRTRTKHDLPHAIIRAKDKDEAYIKGRAISQKGGYLYPNVYDAEDPKEINRLKKIEKDLESQLNNVRKLMK